MILPIPALIERERLDHTLEGGQPGIWEEHIARYRFAASFVAGKSVLDVACGTGYGTAHLKDAGAIRAVGVDISDAAISTAKSSFGERGVRYLIGDAQELSLGEEFDVVTSFETIEHIPRPEKFLEVVVSHLSPTGVFLVSTPTRQHGSLETKPLNPFHIREWIQQEFNVLLRGFFQNVEFFWQYELLKYRVPYSRTLQRKILRLISPRVLAELDRYPVLPHPPKVPSPFRVTGAYMVAVCGLRRGSKVRK